jgi:DNA (cytosine-5)-methyltransferase 1
MKHAIDLFAGCGGASLGLHRAGYEVLGVEFDAQAHATHEAAGMECILADVRNLNPALFVGVDHLHASPPCQTFSTAGKGTGRDSVAALSAAVRDVLNGAQPAELDIDVADERTLLTLEPARWIAALKPSTISLEQVRGVLPIWQAYAEGLRVLGYSAWWGLVNAEQFGIPQNRVRAWLGARRDGIEAHPPTPTHSRYYNRTPDRLDPGVAKWVSMAEGLGWDDGDLVGFPRRADNGAVTTIDGVDYRARDLREASAPAFGLTEKARSWTHYAPAGVSQTSHPARPRRLDAAPAPTITGVGNGYVYDEQRQVFGQPISGPQGARKLTTAEALALQGFPTRWPWADAKPAPTICGDPRLSAPGGHHTPGSQYGPGAGKLTPPEALALQGFPTSWPLVGTRTAQFRQIGNAVPPHIARVVVEALTASSSSTSELRLNLDAV